MSTLTDSLVIPFSTHDHPFCESSIYGTAPHAEYVNMISALFLIFIGYIGVTRPNIHSLAMLAYLAILLNGVAAFFYHWNHTIGWGMFDRMTLVLLAITTILFIMETVTLSLPVKKNSYALLLIYFSVLLVTTSLQMESIFDILFGVFIVFILVFCLCASTPAPIKKYAWYGGLFLTIGGLIWILSERYCSIPWVKYLFGHTIWHVGVSLGGYLLLLQPQYNYLKKTFPNQSVLVKSILS